MPSAPDDAVTISGRVVNFETCLSQAGCQSAPELRVSLLADSKVVSNRTGNDGAFSLPAVPRSSVHQLIVSDASGAQRFLPTLQAGSLQVDAEDLFGLELFAVEASGGLYQAAGDEVGFQIESAGLYLGQVVAIVEGQMKAIAGVEPTIEPAADQLRFVRDNPRFNPGEAAFFPAERQITGVFGQFLVVVPQEPRSYTVTTSVDGYSTTSITARLGAGHLTVGVHRVRPEPGAAP